MHGIVAQSRGHVWAETATGRERFTVLLPAATPPAGASASTMAGAGAASPSPTVLIVEDEVSVRELLARILAD